jgi:hypothetical protein
VHALVLAARLRGGFDGALPRLDPPFRANLPASPAPALRLALSRPRIGWGRELFGRAEGEGGAWADPYRDALRDQVVRAIDMKDYARAASLGDELTKREEEVSSNDPRTVALVAESLRLGGGSGDDGTAGGRASGAGASLSYLSKKSSSVSFPSSPFSCHPWILFVRAMAAPPGDFACLNEDQREGFARAVAAGRQRGWRLTEWSRALTTGQP